MAVIRNKIDKP